MFWLWDWVKKLIILISIWLNIVLYFWLINIWQYKQWLNDVYDWTKKMITSTWWINLSWSKNIILNNEISKWLTIDNKQIILKKIWMTNWEDLKKVKDKWILILTNWLKSKGLTDKEIIYTLNDLYF